MKTSLRPRSAPGTDPSNARSAILDAAEAVFSHSGYDGASMRMIANEAGVAQALLHYHFQNKDRLFEAVFERRSNAASGHRGQLLTELMEREQRTGEVLRYSQWVDTDQSSSVTFCSVAFR